MDSSVGICRLNNAYIYSSNIVNSALQAISKGTNL
jgi:hypothetical protein